MFAKSARNRLLICNNFGSESGQSIGLAELTLLDNLVIGGEEISASYFLTLIRPCNTYTVSSA